MALRLYSFFWLSIAVSNFAIASPNPPDPAARVLKTGASRQTVVLELSAPSGHHFNLKTTNSVSLLKADGATDRTLKQVAATDHALYFAWPALVADAAMKAKVFLCDDAKTYCIKKTLALEFSKLAVADGEVPVLASTGVTPVAKTATQKGAKKAAKGAHWEHDPVLALKLAQKTNKRLLIDFFGIWCPPCNMLDSFVFGTPEFKAAAKDYVLLKLDADSEASWEYKEKYQVTGYPTLVIADSDGKELARRVGYLPLLAFVDLLAKPTAVAVVQAAATDSTQPEKRSWKENWDQWSEQYFSAKEEGPKKDSEKKLLAALGEIPVETLSALDQADVFSTAAQVVSKSQDAGDAKVWWRKAALAYEPLGENRGVSLEKAYAYWQAGEIVKAEQIYKKKEAEFPREFTFYYNHGRMMQDLKKFDVALELGNKALQFSYGDNKLRAVHLVAGSYKELGDGPKALALLEKTLNLAAKPKDPKNRTYRHLKQLEELKATLSTLKN